MNKIKVPQTEQEKDMLESIFDFVLQACSVEDDKLDSMCSSTYADGIKTLAEYGKVKILKERGRRIIAKVI